MIRPIYLIVVQACLFCGESFSGTSNASPRSGPSSASALHAHLGRYLTDYTVENTVEKHSNQINEESSYMNQQSVDFDIDSRRERSPLSRRDAINKAAAATVMSGVTVLSATGAPKAAIAADLTTEPTKIQMTVETDYLIQTMEYFEGDMRKVLGAICRSPFTTVEMTPPNSNKDAVKEAILRALYSYEAPEDYVDQTKWLNVEETDNNLFGWLTRKRYTFTIPNPRKGSYSYNESENKLLYQEEPMKTSVSLSNLEIGAGAAVVAYPATYVYYQYENYREEKQAQAKKAALAAKRAASKKAGAKKEGAKPAAKTAAKGPSAATQPTASKGPKAVKPKAAAKVPAAKKEAKEPYPKSDQTDAVWRRLQSQIKEESNSMVANNAPAESAPAQTAAPLPEMAAPIPVPAPVIPAPAVPAPAPLPSPASTCAPSGNAGMDAYDSYLRQAYATSATANAPVPAPAVASASVALAAPVDSGSADQVAFDGLSCKAFKLDQLEQARGSTSNEPAEELASPPSPPARKSSPFGSYLDTL